MKPESVANLIEIRKVAVESPKAALAIFQSDSGLMGAIAGDPAISWKEAREVNAVFQDLHRAAVAEKGAGQ